MLYNYVLPADELFLIIHNIDGVMLRGSKVQSVLSSLAQISAIHIIASIDHINAPLSKYIFNAELMRMQTWPPS